MGVFGIKRALAWARDAARLQKSLIQITCDAKPLKKVSNKEIVKVIFF